MSLLLANLEVPVIQAPMAGAATPLLAAEVSRAGGLGALGLGASSPQDAARMMQETRQRLGSGRFGVNLFCHRPAHRDPAREAGWLEFLAPEFARHGAVPPASLHEIYPSFLQDDDMLAAVIAARPVMISFHFGLPDAARIAALRQTGAVLMASATSLSEAHAIRDAGLDAIIAQGFEAGGHRGIFDPDGPDACQPAMDLMSGFKGLGLPLIAAGGIMTGADAAHHLRAGAVAVQMGTAFLACPESAAGPDWRARLRLGRTVMTRAISGRPARGLENRLVALGMRPDAPALPDYPVAYDAAKALHAAAGGSDYAAQWAGTGAARARAMPAARLVAQLAAEIAEALQTS
ncbi:NAD(P)H-dependent flavin oxidoreductase [Paracoccus shanxieyensis]|uniref:Propionate 3-nitronate monooxygenase n=1 Tax=Paracoccus shanxieyensis TaxID=2675752 RepID=A0A6L6IW68_9RHOB|nr:nitronate monooxygenase [Paracoccus shanxieyensis]MTH63848.1 nitronate monooxygenase [Paracoccus shanxieyensis]MTH86640.1 nitronate monooxygenase [Paracoccus shanxieyensis]